MSTPIFAAAIDRYRALGLWGADPVIRREGYDRLQAAMRAAGALSRDIAFDACVDTSLAEQASPLSNAHNARNRRGNRATAPLGGSFSLQRQPFRLALANVERKHGHEPAEQQPEPVAAAARAATA